jgi:hypothetical protein
MTKEYNRFYDYITSTECYGGFPEGMQGDPSTKDFLQVQRCLFLAGNSFVFGVPRERKQKTWP